jgi:hypothetical protein
VTDEALALAFRTGLPYVGLRDHAHDADLDRIVPPAAARAARAIPLAAEDHRIRLAVADPDADLSPLDRYLIGREVQLALAPREELDAILGPPEPRPFVAEAPEQIAVAEPEPEQAVGTGTEEEATEPEAAAATDPDHPLVDEPEEDATQAGRAAATDPDGPLAAEPEQAAGQPGPVATAEPEAAGGTGSDEDAAQREPAATTGVDEDATAEPERAAGTGTEEDAAQPEPATTGDDAAPERSGLAGAEPGPASAAELPAPLDDHPELAGEVPSWLEPPRRGWRVVLIVLMVIVVLAVAAGVVVAFVNA